MRTRAVTFTVLRPALCAHTSVTRPPALRASVPATLTFAPVRFAAVSFSLAAALLELAGRAAPDRAARAVQAAPPDR